MLTIPAPRARAVRPRRAGDFQKLARARARAAPARRGADHSYGIFMYATLYTTCITFYTIASRWFLNHVAARHYSIVTINSTSTHMMYEIV